MVIRKSVRQLVEFVYRHGDIDNQLKTAVTMQEGSLIHRQLQADYRDFEPEVALSESFQIDQQLIFKLSGRADGIKDDGSAITINEIKTVFVPVEDADLPRYDLHWYQAMLYGAIYSERHGRRSVKLRLTYYAVQSTAQRHFERDYSYRALREFLMDTVDRYRPWLRATYHLLDISVRSASGLDFPYTGFRRGQETMARAIYQTIRDGHQALIEAPTGIGKTMAALYPAVKSLADKKVRKIYYLTAKTVQRHAVLHSLQTLMAKGLETLAVVITAKSKICLNDNVECTAKACPYAAGHYNRINEALATLTCRAQLVTANIIRQTAKRHLVCPYELALELTAFSALIICDYNYVFDPFVKLSQTHPKKAGVVLLIDEAHNLAERSRAMYSAALSLSELKEAAAAAQKVDSRYAALLEASYFSLSKHLETVSDNHRLMPLTAPHVQQLTRCLSYYIDEGRFTELSQSEELRRHFFQLYRFVKLTELSNQAFALSYQAATTDIHLTCLDASHYLADSYSKVRAAICFSATLSPLQFFSDLLALTTAKKLQLVSPFPAANCQKYIFTGYSTYATDRERSIVGIATLCRHLLDRYTGHFMIFCPSYHYLEHFSEVLQLKDGETISCQSREMSETARDDFIAGFDERVKPRRIGLVVTGGIFSEGVDLANNRLCGVIVIGVGLPAMTGQREQMRRYYTAQGYSGFDYAYSYPGLNKVLQAAGRLIRTESDRGVIALIGKRYQSALYRRALPPHWRDAKVVATLEHSAVNRYNKYTY